MFHGLPEMFVALTVFVGVALCQADPETVTGRIILANLPDHAVSARNHECPAGYFYALVPLKALTFKRGRNVVRRNSRPSSLDQVQCRLFPDTVYCELLEGVVLCLSGDASRPLLPKKEFKLDCEVAPGDEACFLEGSCFLLCDFGMSIFTIICLVVTALFVIGMIAFCFVKRCRRT